MKFLQVLSLQTIDSKQILQCYIYALLYIRDKYVERQVGRQGQQKEEKKFKVWMFATNKYFEGLKK